MSSYIIGTQDSVGIDTKQAWMRVRGGGIGGGTWLARITGPHPKFKLEREFVDRDTSGLSRSGASGTMTWAIPGPGLYEYRDWCSSSSSTDSGFVEVTEDDVTPLSRTEVLARVTPQDEDTDEETA